MKPRDTGEKHLRFAVLATDVILMTIKENTLFVRLIRVHRPPHFSNSSGLPGGLIRPHETAEEAARRLLSEKGEIETTPYLEQLYTFSRIDRDPRGRVVAVAYSALIPWDSLTEQEQQDTSDAWWTPLREATGLAYDHDEMLAVALTRLRSRVHYTTLIRHLMPHDFTLSELEASYECILKAELDKRNFRKKLLKQNVLTSLDRKKTGGAHRPALLYSFKGTDVEEIEMI